MGLRATLAQGSGSCTRPLHVGILQISSVHFQRILTDHPSIRKQRIRVATSSRTSWLWLGSICIGNHVTALASACLATPCPACRTSCLWLGCISVGNHVTALASACVATSLTCMLFQLALAGKHFRWKPRHCVGLCMRCCVPDLHVVLAGIGWIAFTLITHHCIGFCL